MSIFYQILVNEVVYIMGTCLIMITVTVIIIIIITVNVIAVIELSSDDVAPVCTAHGCCE